jgi:hypothetical protein
MAAKNQGGGTALLGMYLGLLTVVLLFVLFGIWPAVEAVSNAADGQAQNQNVELFGVWSLTLTPGGTLVVLAVVMGALGSVIHASTSFTSYVGNREFRKSWTWWYVLRGFIGAPLGLLLYFAVVGGLFAISSESTSLNAFTIGALAGLGGLFSKNAIDWLSKVFDSMFQADIERKDSLEETRPQIESTRPNRVAAGTDCEITIVGKNIPSDPRVIVAGQAMPSTNIGEVSGGGQEIVVTIPGALLTPDSVSIVIERVGPGGTSSEPYELTVTSNE